MTESVDKALAGHAKTLHERGLANRKRRLLEREEALRVEAAVLSADLRMTVSRDSRPHKCFVDGFAAAIQMMEAVQTTDELAEFVAELKSQLDNDSQA